MKYYASKYIGYYFTTGLLLLIPVMNIWPNFIYQIIGIFTLFIMLIYNIIKSDILKVTVFDVLILLLFIYEIILYFISISRDVSLLYLQNSFFVTLYYFSLRTYVDRKRKITFLLNAFSVYFFFLSVISLFSFFLFVEKMDLLGFQNPLEFKNLYAPLGQMSNVWATYLLCFSGFILLTFSQTKYGLCEKYVLGIILSLLFLGIIHTFSRGAYVCLFLFLFFICVYIFRLKISLLKRTLCLLFIGLAVLTTFGLQKGALDTLRMNVTQSQKRSSEARVNSLKVAINIFRESPVLGVGSGNYSLAANKFFYENDNNTYVKWSANSGIQLIVEKGIIGFVLWLLVFVLLLNLLIHIRVTKLPASIIIITLIILVIKELTFSSYFEHIGLQLLVFTLFAIFQNGFCSKKYKLNNYPRRKFILISTYTLIYCWLLSVIISYLKNEENTRKFVIAMHDNNMKESQKYINKATGNAACLINKCLFEWTLYEQTLNKMHLQYAKYHLQKAIDQKKNDYLLQHNMANILQYEGRNDSALIILSKLVNDFPQNTLYQISLGKLLYKNGNADLALIHFEKAIRISPTVLDAPFWINFERSDSINATIIKDRLKKNMIKTEDPILISKYGKICLNLKDTIGAEKYLNKAITLLPNLSRPWYYLGMIAHYRGDSVKALRYISISEELSRIDYFTASYLSKHYFSQNDSLKGKDYQDRALSYLEILNSERNRKYQMWYNSKPLNNQIIPTMLQYEIIPEIYYKYHFRTKRN